MSRVGQKVVCVDDTEQRNRRFRIAADEVYTIQAIKHHADCFGSAGPCAFLSELQIEICPIIGEPAPFSLSRFRPIVERKTDISIFTAMLKTEGAPALTRARAALEG